MSTRQKGYAGQTGLYLPAEKCHISQGPAATMIQGPSIEKQWPLMGAKMHCHLKNIRISPGGPSGVLLTFGGFNKYRALQFTVYFVAPDVLEIVTTSTRPYSGGGRYYAVDCNERYEDGTTVTEGDKITVFSKSTPKEIEARLENGLYSVIVDGKPYISALDLTSGTFSGSGNAGWPISPNIKKHTNVSYDLVDFTYETSETSCRFVPMKTAEGKDAIYEAYSQQVVEI